MNILKPALLLAMVILVAISCQESINPLAIESTGISQTDPSILQTDYSCQRNGKIKSATRLPEVFTSASLDTLPFPEINDDLVQALEHQLKVLELRKKKKNQRIAGLDVSTEKLEKTIRILLERGRTNPANLALELDAHQTWGTDRKGHVQFTGYFTPVLRVKKKPDGLYRFPIYAYPKNWQGALPTRQAIDGEGVLKGKGLELAYASNILDIYYMQVQGSGYVKFIESGEQILLRFAGSNGKKYRSIEKHIMRDDDLKVSNLSMEGIKRYFRKYPEKLNRVLYSNPSYIFFQPTRAAVKGSGGVPLIEDISIAADPNYFPPGSVLLASVPVYNRSGEIDYHEYRLLMPQDVGGAVRGPGHVDIYSGIGAGAKRKASMRHHYGRMWILLPKENGQLALND